MADFRQLHQQRDQPDRGGDGPAGQCGAFRVAKRGQQEREGERLHQHFGHESLAVKNAQGCEDEEGVGPESLRPIEHPSPDGLQEEKGQPPEDHARQLTAEVEIARHPLDAEREIVVEREFEDIAPIEIADPRDARGEREARLFE